MLPPDAQTQDITSFWMPFGASSESGRIHPLVFSPSPVIAVAAAANSLRFVGGAATPAWVSRSSFVNIG